MKECGERAADSLCPGVGYLSLGSTHVVFWLWWSIKYTLPSKSLPRSHPWGRGRSPRSGPAPVRGISPLTRPSLGPCHPHSAAPPRPRLRRSGRVDRRQRGRPAPPATISDRRRGPTHEWGGQSPWARLMGGLAHDKTCLVPATSTLRNSIGKHA